MDETFYNISEYDFGYDEAYNEGMKDATQLHILGLIIKSNQNNTSKFDNQNNTSKFDIQ